MCAGLRSFLFYLWGLKQLLVTFSCSAIDSSHICLSYSILILSSTLFSFSVVHSCLFCSFSSWSLISWFYLLCPVLSPLFTFLGHLIFPLQLFWSVLSLAFTHTLQLITPVQLLLSYLSSLSVLAVLYFASVIPPVSLPAHFCLFSPAQLLPCFYSCSSAIPSCPPLSTFCTVLFLTPIY